MKCVKYSHHRLSHAVNTFNHEFVLYKRPSIDPTEVLQTLFFFFFFTNAVNSQTSSWVVLVKKQQHSIDLQDQGQITIQSANKAMKEAELTSLLILQLILLLSFTDLI